MKADQLEAGILVTAEHFTVRDVVDRLGGSPMTVKVILDRWVAQEKVTEVGERTAGRGRAARLWKVA